jgi:quinol monooxygenase YgiN
MPAFLLPCSLQHAANKGKTSKQQAHVIIRYTVPPSKQEALLDAWNKAEKGVEGEKGAHIYSLRKVLGDNMHYIAYGTWETMQDYEEHFK